MYPILFAGIWSEYSKSARNQDPSIITYNGMLENCLIPSSFKCPYQANVINILEATSNKIVYNAFIRKFIKKIKHKIRNLCL